MGIYWKMSTDLSRPLVSAMGSHDALDGSITFREVQSAMTTTSAAGGMNIAEQSIPWLLSLRTGIGRPMIRSDSAGCFLTLAVSAGYRKVAIPMLNCWKPCWMVAAADLPASCVPDRWPDRLHTAWRFESSAWR